MRPSAEMMTTTMARGPTYTRRQRVESAIVTAHTARQAPREESLAEGANENVTILLDALSSGDDSAAERLLPLIYEDLHDRAERLMRRERANHTLQPTALVHEAYVRLVDQRVAQWANRSHFLGVACEAMHRVLLDHARSKHRLKRGGGAAPVALPDVEANSAAWSATDLVPLAEAIEALGALDDRQATVVKLRFFAGLSEEQAAQHLGVSRRTVQQDWAHARAWLRRRLAEESADGS